MRRRARRDQAHAPIVRALQAVGCDVLDLAAVGGGCPDLLVHRARRLVLIEVKGPPGPRGGTSAKGQKLNAAQEAFRLRWPVAVARTVDDALKAIGAIR